MKWPIVSLSEALASAEVFVDGDWVESKDQDPEGDVRLVQLADVGDGKYIDKSDRFLTSAKARKLRCTFLKPGDVMVARMPDPLGRACIFPGDSKPSVTVVDVCIIRPDEREHEARWLMYCLNAPTCRNQIAGFATGTTRSRISRCNLARIKVPLPPLAEQRRIADVLDRAEELRSKRRATFAQLDSLTHSIFIDLFGEPVTNPKSWPVMGIEDACELIVDCVNRTAAIVDEPTSFKMIRTSNVKAGKVNLAEVRYVTEEVFNRWNRRATPQRSDVLLTREAPVGEAGMLESDDRVFLGQRLMLYRVNRERMTPEYLLASFRGAFLQHQFNRHGSGSTVKHLPLPACRSFKVHVPPIALQREFARRVRAVETLKTAQRASLAELDALFATLQHRAFNGELFTKKHHQSVVDRANV